MLLVDRFFPPLWVINRAVGDGGSLLGGSSQEMGLCTSRKPNQVTLTGAPVRLTGAHLLLHRRSPPGQELRSEEGSRAVASILGAG